VPRLSVLRSTALNDLVSQVRYSPRAVLLRQAERAEALAAEIDPQLTYPEDWLVFRVTGYAPEAPDPRLLHGAGVLEDLSALVERLTDAGELAEGAPEAEGLGIDALCQRWKVSRRTLERFRRQGLVARRVRAPAERGRTRLVFSGAAVAAFERRRALAPRSRPVLRRVSKSERDRLISAARALKGRHEVSLNRIATRVARDSGRSVHTVRRVLKSTGASPDEAPGARSGFGRATPLSVAEHAFIWRALRWGADPSRLARRLSRGPAAIRRAADRHLLKLLLGLGLPSDEPSMQTGRELPNPLLTSLPSTLQQLEQLVQSARPMPPKTERALASAYRALRADAGRLTQEGAQAPVAASALLDLAATNLRNATPLKLALVRETLPLIVRTIEERLGTSLAAADPRQAVRFLDAGVSAASDAIDQFDPSRGGRVAAPVSVALARALAPARAGPRSAGLARKLSDGPGLELPSWLPMLCPWATWLSPHPAFERGVDRLPPRQRGALRVRYALDGTALTASQIRSRFGIGPAGLARAYRRAVAIGRL